MDKKDYVEKLMKETNRSENECIVINSILEDHFIIGKNNKIKIMEDFKEKLNINDEEADELYNICAELIIKGIIKRG